MEHSTLRQLARERLEVLGWTPLQAARELGISKNTLADIGKWVRPRPGTLEALSRLGATSTQIAVAVALDQMPEEGMPQDVKQLVVWLAGRPPERRATLISLMRHLDAELSGQVR